MKVTLLLFHLTFTLLVLFLSTTTCWSQEPHIIKLLPGYPGELPFTLETGYVGVGESEKVQLFYYFVESERDVEKDPLLIWLTGGPGCSVFSGFVLEIGPLSFNLTAINKDLDIPKLQQNPYSWTKVASIIFVDSPVGTGFSYATTSEAYNSSDTLQSTHIYDFLRNWIDKHPKFTDNPLYVAGDSYSGITIPIIVQEILRGNEAGLSPKLNLKGYAIGNPVTDHDVDANAKYEYARRTSLISDEIYESAMINCNGDFVNVDASNTKCLHSLDVMKRNTNDVLNEGHVLEPNCKSPKLFTKLSQHKYPKRDALLDVDDGCPVNLQLTNLWANNKQVRKALHIREGSIGNWIRCNSRLAYESNVKSSFNYHLNMSTKDLRVLIFSGDQDMVVPYVGTLKWINKLEIPISDDWRPWFVDGQVGGYVTEFSRSPNRLAFTTIKGGSHTAPENKPRECYAMIERWLLSSPL